MGLVRCRIAPRGSEENVPRIGDVETARRCRHADEESIGGSVLSVRGSAKKVVNFLDLAVALCWELVGSRRKTGVWMVDPAAGVEETDGISHPWTVRPNLARRRNAGRT